ncbi:MULTISPECIES: DUF4395 domain-containing protein [Mycobacteriaceae]|uniref:DUF4395 domain-containing protein n=1 Tax=Mycolicibacterium mucogenicum DSM 44124 TaxID=1226753 RepID=A0A8H2J8T7_MYCMU|nr:MULTISPECIES: DUF4395 domain-containing protein [Mycobacteriaceae]KAB7761136.1 membrane protein [Mycolicibacterium mucogenicum DSM 44124]QPG69939.1 DUF4395 domain-containing protein [Mycolicibacterium mucogenicum DSM 44124]
MSDNSIETPQVDVRGPRFAAWVTTAVLILTLLVSAASPIAAAVILGLQAVVFAIGAIGGPRKHPYGRIFATFIAPRLAPVSEKEPVAPLKFAQLVGLLFAIVGFVGFATGITALGLGATAFALIAAFLNAAFGICLGCQIYPLVARFRGTGAPATT